MSEDVIGQITAEYAGQKNLRLADQMTTLKPKTGTQSLATWPSFHSFTNYCDAPS